MRRISRMLLPFAVWCFAVFAGYAATAETAGDPGTDASSAGEWTAADAELAVLSYLIAAQRADAWAAYADAVARMHADAAVLARFGLAPPDEALRLDGQRASAFAERDAAQAAKEAARAQLAERLLSAASRAVPPAMAEPAGRIADGESAATEEEAAGEGTAEAKAGSSGGEAGETGVETADAVDTGGEPIDAVETGVEPADAGETGAEPAGAGETGVESADAGEIGVEPIDAVETGVEPADAVETGAEPTDAGEIGVEPADTGETGAEPANAGEDLGVADSGEVPAASDGIPYPETLLQAERAMRQACRQVDAASLLAKAGMGSTAALAEAHAGCLQAELAWIDAQAEGFGALLAGAKESGGGSVALPALLDMVRDHQPELYGRWIRLLKADSACQTGESASASAAVRIIGADGLEASPPSGCAIGLPGVRLASTQPPLHASSGDVWLPLRPYAVALGMSLEWNAAEKRIVLAAGEQRISIAPGSAAIEWIGGGHEMAHAVLSVNGQSFVPAEFFRALFGLNLYWDDHVRAGWLLP